MKRGHTNLITGYGNEASLLSKMQHDLTGTRLEWNNPRQALYDNEVSGLKYGLLSR
jgi:hypothetical protein